MSKHKHSPLPWSHWTGSGGTSAVLDAAGKVVSGSMIIKQSPESIANHKLIVASVDGERIAELEAEVEAVVAARPNQLMLIADKQRAEAKLTKVLERLDGLANGPFDPGYYVTIREIIKGARDE